MAGYNRNQYSYVDPGDVGGPQAPMGMTEPPAYPQVPQDILEFIRQSVRGKLDQADDWLSQHNEPYGKEYLDRLKGNINQAIDRFQSIPGVDFVMGGGAPTVVGTTLEDLMKIYPKLRAARYGLSSVNITDTINQLGESPDIIKQILKDAAKKRQVELVPHSGTQPLSPEEIAAAIELDPTPGKGLSIKGQKYLWWRPTE